MVKTVETIARIGDYMLTEKLGDGAYSVVRNGLHVHNGQHVAVKITAKSETEAVARLRCEIAIGGLMDHRNIIKQLDVCENDEFIGLVMELAEHGEVFQKIVESGRLKETQARKLLRQLVDGVEFIHEKNVAHRDLKPENLLIDSTGHIKIIDFGVACFVGQEDKFNHVGTPEYAAPEVWRDGKYDGRAADIWSIGVILFVAITGRLPFVGAEKEDLYKAVCECKIEYPKDLSGDLRDIIQAILQADPLRRPTIAEIKMHPWFRDDHHHRHHHHTHASAGGHHHVRSSAVGSSSMMFSLDTPNNGQAALSPDHVNVSLSSVRRSLRDAGASKDNLRSLQQPMMMPSRDARSSKSYSHKLNDLGSNGSGDVAGDAGETEPIKRNTSALQLNGLLHDDDGPRGNLTHYHSTKRPPRRPGQASVLATLPNALMIVGGDEAGERTDSAAVSLSPVDAVEVICRPFAEPPFPGVDVEFRIVLAVPPTDQEQDAHRRHHRKGERHHKRHPSGGSRHSGTVGASGAASNGRHRSQTLDVHRASADNLLDIAGRAPSPSVHESTRSAVSSHRGKGEGRKTNSGRSASSVPPPPPSPKPTGAGAAKPAAAPSATATLQSSAEQKKGLCGTGCTLL